MKDILIQISFLRSRSALQFQDFIFQVFEASIFDKFRDFGFRGFGPQYFQLSFLSKPSTSEIPTYSTLRAHMAQWLPTTTMACGMLMRAHIAF
jgi:hypothetical protein